ncbi:kinase-like domain-containing protein [Butyriboletus roseoflavus]|nr:kinase-like domain-containing protein [Butyriboletus roseoflavus]
MASLTDTPPRAPPIKYNAHLGTRWQKEKAAAGVGAFDFPEDPKYIGQWIIGECVGKGASGRVRIAKHRRTGKLAAVKILPLQPLMNSRASLATHLAKSEKQRLGIDREIIMMKLMNHPNILRIYDVFEGENELYLVLEYVEGGELFDFLVNRGRLPPLDALAFFKQIVYGLNYAHTFSIIHRDLKPENILIHSLNPPLIKLADWGMAAFAPPALQLETSCGSPHYASPEIVNGMKYRGNATDIWSCGVILYALLTGRLPFDDKNVRTLLAKVKTGRYDVPPYVDPLARDLLTRMLVVDVNQRITIPEIMSHPWFNKMTLGILYVPAPSVTELAKPLASEAHVDEELLESLCVIWGKHADVQGIKADLLSPQGEGTLAKAFYFLLHEYREQTLKDHGIILDLDEAQVHLSGKVITKQYRSPQKRSNNLEPDTSIRHGRLHTNRDAPPPPSVSRSRTPSPVGPRAPKPRPVSSPVAEIPTRHKSMTLKPVTTALPSAHAELARTRSSTVTMLPPRIAQDSHNYHAHNQQMYQPMHIPGTPPIAPGPVARMAPVAVPTAWFPVSPHSPHSAGPAISPSIPRAAPVSMVRRMGPSEVRSAPTSPRSGDQDLMIDIEPTTPVPGRLDTVFTYHRNDPFSPEGRPTIKVYREDTSPQVDRSRYSQAPTRHVTMPTSPEDAHQSGRGQENKENSEHFEGRYPYLEKDPVHFSGGLFVKPRAGGRVGKELRNSLHGVEFLKRDGKERERDRKPKSPPLDLHLNTSIIKRPVVGSPTQPTSPGMPPIISSPVGEFKGWFSNLFNWRAHTYVLCSTNNLTATRIETVRILEQLGVTIALEDPDSMHGHGAGTAAVLRCRTNEVFDEVTGAVVQKHVRFRVEFSVGSTGFVAPTIGAGSSAGTSIGVGAPVVGASTTSTGMSSSLMSPRHALAKQTMAVGYACAIVLVQEKGSLSTFRAVCRWLREEWKLDALRSPPGAGPSGQGGYLEQQQQQRQGMGPLKRGAML